jgi:2-methylisocitrate lyase-like PEP mutase family enzyme
MLKALQHTYATLLGEGTQANLLPSMTTRAELYELIDYDEYIQADARLALKASDSKL